MRNADCAYKKPENAETGLDKKLILGHIRGKGTHPFTIKVYADTFSKKLGRTISVADLNGPPR